MSAVSAGRTLALLDVENLLGGTRFCAADVALLREVFEHRIFSTEGTQAVLATSAAQPLIEAFMGWPGARMTWASGKDGADLALLAVIDEDIAERYSHVVIGSGDGIFALATRALRAHGVTVTVVVGEGKPSRALAREADHLVTLFGPEDIGRAA